MSASLSLATVGLNGYLIVAAAVFSAGLVTVMARRNAVAILIGIELMLNAANLNLVAFDRFGPLEINGQLFALFVLAIAAAEAAVAGPAHDQHGDRASDDGGGRDGQAHLDGAVAPLVGRHEGPHQPGGHAGHRDEHVGHTGDGEGPDSEQP